MNDRERNQNWLLDHSIAQAATIAELEMMVWYGTDILLEADAIYRKYGLQHVPGDEVSALLDALRDYLLRVPPIDADCHNHPLPGRPPAPEVGACGEAAPTSGPNVDIHIPDDISGPVADLTEGDAA